jgi:hypothetical protein
LDARARCGARGSRQLSSLNCGQLQTGNSRNFSTEQLGEIRRQVDWDAFSLIFALGAKGFKLDPSEEVYDSEDEEYHQQYANNEVQVYND